MSPLTDDELGARLRAALQEVSPLASDPAPAPRFLAADDAPAGTDVIEVEDLRGIRRPRRGFALTAGVLLAAAVAAGATVLIAAVSGPGDTTAPPVDAAPSGPVRIPLGSTPWRCTAPAGIPIHVQTVQPRTSPDPTVPTHVVVDARDTCAPIPLADSAFVVVDGEVTVPDDHVTRDPSTDDGTRVVGSRRFPFEDGFADTPANQRAWEAYVREAESLPVSAFFDGAHGAWSGAYLLVSRGSVDFIDIYGPGSTISMVQDPAATTAGSPTPATTVGAPPGPSTTAPASAGAPSDAPTSTGASTDQQLTPSAGGTPTSTG